MSVRVIVRVWVGVRIRLGSGIGSGLEVWLAIVLHSP